jgi:TonB family protein
MMMGTMWAQVLATDFPAKALAEKRQGNVKIELAISSVGAVEDCKILESSSHADLDAKTCEIAFNKAKFGPALDLSGQPTAGRVQTEFNWHLPGVGKTPPLPTTSTETLTMPKQLRPTAGESMVSFIVAADGSLLDCKGQTSLDIRLFVPDALCKAKIKMDPFTDSKGKPIARRVTVNTSVKIEDVK